MLVNKRLSKFGGVHDKHVSVLRRGRCIFSSCWGFSEP